MNETKHIRALYLANAEKCICGDRDEQYGSPEQSFDAIADYWNVYLKHKGLNVHLSAKDVAIMMGEFKIARIETGAFSKDSYTDAIGYLACAGEIAETRHEKIEATIGDINTMHMEGRQG